MTLFLASCAALQTNFPHALALRKKWQACEKKQFKLRRERHLQNLSVLCVPGALRVRLYAQRLFKPTALLAPGTFYVRVRCVRPFASPSLLSVSPNKKSSPKKRAF